MDATVLDIFKRSGDANIGQTLVRLARLAEARHQYEHAMTLRGRKSSEAASDRSDIDCSAPLAGEGRR